MPVFERDGVRFSYQVKGSGAALLLLHGLGGDKAQALELGDYPRWASVAVDMRAHGETSPLGALAHLNFTGLAADLAALIDFLGIETVAVIGISMGAGVALRLALDAPQLVRSLTFVRPAWTHESISENLRVFCKIGRLLEEFGSSAGRALFESSSEFLTIRSVSPYTAQSLCDQFEKLNAVERAPRLMLMPRSTPYKSSDELGRVQVPVLVIGCQGDPLHPFETASIWAHSISDAELVEVPNKDFGVNHHLRAARIAVASFLALLS
jgi:pimeloyl-ACP methyl ester carboxylesterase